MTPRPTPRLDSMRSDDALSRVALVLRLNVGFRAKRDRDPL